MSKAHRSHEWTVASRKAYARARRNDEPCCYCGGAIDWQAPRTSGLGAHVDHAVPLSLGGDVVPDPSLLRISHATCNSAAGARLTNARRYGSPLPDAQRGTRAVAPRALSCYDDGPDDYAELHEPIEADDGAERNVRLVDGDFELDEDVNKDTELADVATHFFPRRLPDLDAQERDPSELHASAPEASSAAPAAAGIERHLDDDRRHRPAARSAS